MLLKISNFFYGKICKSILLVIIFIYLICLQIEWI